MFTDTNLVQISDLVKYQFPEFYQEQGPNFIAFIKAYYEWLQQQDNVIGQARSRYKQFDIDTASSEFLYHFKNTYMWGFPPELLGNQRLLQKHIIELYRSKGSQEAIKLLFRLLFNEDISFYVPSYDIFKLSDNTWIEPKFFEVTDSIHFDKLVGSVVTGSSSGARAIVEQYESRFEQGRNIHIIYISNIVGNWIIGDTLLVEGIDPQELPAIRGSASFINVSVSTVGADIGDIFVSQGLKYPVKAVVSNTIVGTGSLNFEVVSGGSYYSLDTEITITGGGGSGANVQVLSLSNTHPYTFNIDPLLPYANVALNGIYGFPKFYNSNTSTIITDSLIYQTITVGTIDKLRVINPGANYTSFATVTATDPYTSTSGIKDSNGNFVGTNAVITGIPVVAGSETISEVYVIDSGFNNANSNNQITFISQSNNQITMLGTVVPGAIGLSEGKYDNTKSFLSDDKYLFDGHYYQDFSYVIRASMNLDRYVEILKLIAHPTGNAVYGDIKIITNNALYNDVIFYTIRKDNFLYIGDQWQDDGVWIDNKSW